MNFSIDHGFGGLGALLVLLAVPAVLFFAWMLVANANAAHHDVEDPEDTGSFEVKPPGDMPPP